MSRIAEVLKSIPRLLLAIGLVAAGLIAFFVAWWIAVVLILGFALYVAVRGVLPRKPPPGSGAGSEIIEGEYRIEKESRIERDDVH
jgi:hypothetical protein